MVSQTTSDRGVPDKLVRYCREVYTLSWNINPADCNCMKEANNQETRRPY